MERRREGGRGGGSPFMMLRDPLLCMFASSCSCRYNDSVDYVNDAACFCRVTRTLLCKIVTTRQGDAVQVLPTGAITDDLGSRGGWGVCLLCTTVDCVRVIVALAPALP